MAAAIIQAVSQDLENFKKALNSHDLRSAESQLGQIKVAIVSLSFISTTFVI